jgi:MoaA/NifB/PqqE/SkfB family radical SAM enzyme
VDNVTVSLDGPEEVHDRIRGAAGTFRRATEGIRALQEARRRAAKDFPAIKVNCVITRHSIPTLLDTYQIVRELGVGELNLQHPIFDTAGNIELHNRVFPRAMEQQEALGCRLETEDRQNGLRIADCGLRIEETEGGREKAGRASRLPIKELGEYYDEQLTTEQYEQLEAALLTMLRRRNAPPRIEFFPPVARKDWRGYYLDLTYPFRRRCTAPWTTMRLLADGTFEPCLHYVIGNVLETPLWELWNCPRMRDFRVRLLRNGLFPACVRCCYRCY